MSRNLYLGADFEMLCPASTALPLKQIVSNFYRFVESTRFAERAGKIAEEVQQRQPQVLCLQEVFSYRVIRQENVVAELDFLDILLDQLNHEYVQANIAPATGIELPIVWQNEDAILQIQDSDVILLQKDTRCLDNGAEIYRDLVTLQVPNSVREDRVNMQVKRGYGWVDIAFFDQVLRIVNTHLESISREIQLAQACELMGAMADIQSPLLLVGDMNAAPGGLVYQHFVTDRPGGGYQDPFRDGPDTWGCAADLRDLFMDARMRIDHILHRGSLDVERIEVFGDQPQDRTPGGLWPSDHAGLAAWYRQPVSE